MKKDQPNNGRQNKPQHNHGLTGNAPGQVLPEKDNDERLVSTSDSDKKEQHSESSRPQKDNETLGTP